MALCSAPLILAQTIAAKLSQSVKDVVNAPQAVAANLSLYVADENGKLIYEYNGNKGLSTASTQKIFTAAAALETLGKDYRYTTTVSTSGTVRSGVLNGPIIINSTGDPTLGSWRYEGYKPEDFMEKIASALAERGITSVSGDIVIDDSYFDFQNIPGGWPWNDIGNYYGAGVWGVNWRENQFDMNMNGKNVRSFNVDLPNVAWVNDLKTAGNSDQSIIYTAPHSSVAYVAGALPDKNITVSGATPNPPQTLGYDLKKYLQAKNIIVSGNVLTASGQRIQGNNISTKGSQLFVTHQSPTLDKIVYWFLRKSVNLYGETLIKTMAREKKGAGNFDLGVAYLKDFWKSKGINAAMINFADGSGLSPQNYVSAKAEVQALLYAKKQPWFNAYFEGFPTQTNGFKMKSGTMKDVKSFAGYHNGYVFSVIINNYQGSEVEALFKILNQLK